MEKRASRWCLPLNDLVFFPGSEQAFFCGTPLLKQTLDACAEDDMLIVVVRRRESEVRPETIDRVGTLASLRALYGLPDGIKKAFVQGLRRVKLLGFTEENGTLAARYEELRADRVEVGPRLMDSARDSLERYFGALAAKALDRFPAGKRSPHDLLIAFDTVCRSTPEESQKLVKNGQPDLRALGMLIRDRLEDADFDAGPAEAPLLEALTGSPASAQAACEKLLTQYVQAEAGHLKNVARRISIATSADWVWPLVAHAPGTGERRQALLEMDDPEARVGAARVLYQEATAKLIKPPE